MYSLFNTKLYHIIIVFQNITGAGFGINLWQFVWQFRCYSGKFCLGCSGLILPPIQNGIFHQQQNIQSVKTRTLPDITPSPDIFQNLDSLVPILVWTAIMTKKLQKVEFFNEIKYVFSFQHQIISYYNSFFRISQW